MENVINHKLIVRDLVESIGKMTPTDEYSETQIILDEEQGHFLLLDLGWHHKTRTYLPFVHLDVMSDGKIWIQHDGTDLDIAEQLVKKGIAKKDIVLAFKAPHVREMIEGYAPA